MAQWLPRPLSSLVKSTLFLPPNILAPKPTWFFCSRLLWDPNGIPSDPRPCRLSSGHSSSRAHRTSMLLGRWVRSRGLSDGPPGGPEPSFPQDGPALPGGRCPCILPTSLQAHIVSLSRVLRACTPALQKNTTGAKFLAVTLASTIFSSCLPAQGELRAKQERTPPDINPGHL